MAPQLVPSHLLDYRLRKGSIHVGLFKSLSDNISFHGMGSWAVQVQKLCWEKQRNV